MADRTLPNVPIWDDIRTLEGKIFKGSVDIIYGGFPCQDISIAGHGKGLEGERSGLFFEMLRLAKELKPTFLFLENVPAITTRGGLRVVKELTDMGYDCRWCVISAASIGALHIRKRWFLLAHSKNERLQRQWPISFGNNTEELCNSNSQSSEQTHTSPEPFKNNTKAWGGFTRQSGPFESREHWQETVSSMGKCSNGIPYHAHRLRALGNAVVPEQVKEAFKILMGIRKK
jgi:DNA (cytosine-5)-methyltransferase 1